MTEKTIIPKNELKHGMYYLGKCRNATMARWNTDEQCFYHWRTKLGRTFIETIRHRQDDDIFDVFDPFEEILNPEKEITFD